jgi:aspartyl-tRNA(Asn)/glutamyl-tRNA(Gln) amidotransferase subunit C
MNKQKIIEISKSLKFKVDDKIAIEIEKTYKEFQEKFEKLKNINTDKVKPMTRIDETPIFFLREDIPKKGLSKEKFLKNAPSKDKNYVVINNKDLND